MKKKIIIIVVFVMLGIGGLVFLLINKNVKLIGEVVPQIVMNESGSPIFVEGKLLNTSIESNNDVYKALNELADMYGFKDAKNEFDIISTSEALNFKYYKVSQKYKNIPVFGKEIVLTVDENNKVLSVTGHYYKDIDVNTYSKLKVNEVLEILKGKFDVENLNISDGKRYIYINDDGKVYNSYIFTVVTISEYSDYVMDANTGDVIDVIAKRNSASEIITLKGVDGENYDLSLSKSESMWAKGVYEFEDTNRNIVVVDATGVAKDLGNENNIKFINALNYLYFQMLPNDPIQIDMYGNPIDDRITSPAIIQDAVISMVNFTKTYDYYKNVLGRSSFDDKNGQIVVNIGYQNDLFAPIFSNNEWNNASWGAGEFHFGSTNKMTYAAALDVVAHEFTHAVTDYIADFEYKGESGALNEAYSDIMGSLIEGKNFNLGEDVEAMRNMANPNEFKDPAIYEGKYFFPTDEETYNEDWRIRMLKAYKEAGMPLDDWKDYDNGGVHVNSGVPNYAAYLMYDNGAFSSKEEMAKVWYSSQYRLTKQSTFEDAAISVIQTAKDMNLKEDKVKIIEDAFIQTRMLKTEKSIFKGKVSDENAKKGIEDAQVTLISKLNIHINYKTRTNENGEFQLNDVPIGEYTIVVEKAKYDIKEEEIKIEEDTSLDIKLKKISEANYKESEIIFVLDISASMFDTDPTDIRKQMMVNVIASLNNSAEVALVTFAENASVINNGLSNKQVDKKILMTDVFNMVNDSGHTDNSGTNGRTGLSKALELFTDNEKSRKYIVFFTDGVDNRTEGEPYENIIEKAKDKNIRILSVGLGEGTEIDETQLKALASETKGKYYHATSSDDLYAFDQSIFEELE